MMWDRLSFPIDLEYIIGILLVDFIEVRNINIQNI